MLQAIREEHAGSFVAFARVQSQRTKEAILANALAPEVQRRLEQQSIASLQDQSGIEAADTMPFEIYLQEYLSAKRLLAKPVAI